MPVIDYYLSYGALCTATLQNYQRNYYENLQLILTVEITNVTILVQLSAYSYNAARNDWNYVDH